MKYLSLEIIKRHLNIEEQFDGDDFQLMAMGDAAEEILEKVLDCDLSQLEDVDGHIPASLCHACLLLIGDWYNVRESESDRPFKTTPAFERICAVWHNYSLNK